MKEKVSKILVYLLLLVLGLTMLFPFLWMVATSFMAEFEVFQFPPRFLPEKFKFSNYIEALTALPFGKFFLNSIIVTFGYVFGQLFFCSLAGYAFAKLKFPGRDKTFMIYLSTMMVPVIVTIIPTFLLINTFKLIDTYWALILPGLSSAWGIFLLRQFFLTIPTDLLDAARIDGAGEFMIYWRIMLPLSKPALATLAVFSFMSGWKEFLWALIATNSIEMRPVEVGIAMFSSYFSTNWPYQMAAAVVVMIPIVVVFLFTQKYFIKGISLSGMKG